MLVSHFADFAATSAREQEMSLADLAEMAGRELALAKSDLPWLKLARFGSDRTPRNSLRHNANVLAITGIEGDYDGEVIGPIEAATALRKAGIAGLIYTSPSHTPMLPRWRVLCPLSVDHPPEMRRDLVGRLNAVLGGVLSVESFALSQAYYIGQTPGSAPETHVTDGAPLDLVPTPVFPVTTRSREIEIPPMRQDQSAAEHIEQALRAIAEAFTRRGDLGRHQVVLSATRTLAPFVLSGHIGRHDAEQHVADAMAADGRSPNDGEIAEALRGALLTATAYTPPTNGAEFMIDPPPALPTRPGLRLYRPADCVTSTPRGYIVKHLLAPGDVAALIGPPSAGKSVLAPHLAYAVAQGRAAFGMRTKPSRVLYAAAEDGAGMRQRIRALFDRHGDAPTFAMVEIANLREPAAVADLKRTVAEWSPQLLVVDTLGAAWAGLDENSSVDMGDVVALARSFAAGGCAVLLVHHVAKHGDGTPRGHSALNGTLDMCLALGERTVEGIIRAKVQKNRNGSPDRDIAFRIDVAELGQDEDGDAITAPIAAEVLATCSERPRLSRQQSIAWGEFAKIEAETAPDNAGNRLVSLHYWKEKCGLAALSASSNRDSQRTTFNRACGELYRLGMIAKSDTYAWSVGVSDRYETSETDRDSVETVSAVNRDRRDIPLRGGCRVSVPDGTEFIESGEVQ